MEKRYKLFAKVGVRNIKAFNSRPIAKQEELFADQVPQPAEEEVDKVPDRIPYIVIVVDELADLMLVAQADVELAQLLVAAPKGVLPSLQPLASTPRVQRNNVADNFWTWI